MEGKGERLDKAVGARTNFSRKEIKGLAARGLILVNGTAVRDCSRKVEPGCDQVIVDGVPLNMSRYVYLMMNKPQGAVCATEDAKWPTVLDLIPESLWRKGLFPVGRLDKDTEGLLLITDDGDLSHRLLSPHSHVAKTYFATVDKPIDQRVLDGFREGVRLRPERAGEKERICLPAQLEIQSGNGCTGRVTIYQGIYHQVKRMFEAYDLRVVALKREKIGALILDPLLKPGDCRGLTPQEEALLRNR